MTPEMAPGASSDPTASALLPEPAVADQLAALRGLLRDLDSVLVCYSGGIDSALVLAVAHEVLGPSAIGMTAVSASLAPGEREAAGQFATSIGAQHFFAESRELDRPGYVANGPDRCFHCKTELYTLAALHATRLGLRAVVNGTNADDLGDYRPGLRAADDHSVISPLAALRFSKQDVRAIAQALGIQIWSKPASACLSSRIPYGTAVTPERLAQIGAFEAALKALGFQQVRVRWHDKVARLELGVDELMRSLESGMRERIVAAGKQQGFQYVTLDLQGYRVGSHNEVLSGRQLRVV
jgi:pyridinium-3,5-biscarboxylic acid mononucleotide sulfurtransferase